MPLKDKRTVSINITILDERDNETLEMVAGVMGLAPDDLLDEILAEPIKKQLGKLLSDLRTAAAVADPLTRAALVARGVALDAIKKRGLG